MNSRAYPNAVDWSASLNGTVTTNLRLPLTSYKVAVARSSRVTTEHCPTWNICDGTTRPGSHQAFLIPYSESWQLLPAETDVFTYESHLTCTSQNSLKCMAFLCGQPIVVRAPSAMDWWICSGTSCDSPAGNWQGVCQDSNTCVITMADQDVYVVSLPTSLRSQLDTDGLWSPKLPPAPK